jgi:hypothetical protein
LLQPLGLGSNRFIALLRLTWTERENYLKIVFISNNYC